MKSVKRSVHDSVCSSARYRVWRSVRYSVEDRVWSRVWSRVWDSVCDSVWDSVWDSVGYRVWDNLRNNDEIS